jgi:hypothetical protein
MIEILKPGQGRRPTKYGKRSEPQPAAANWFMIRNKRGASEAVCLAR